MAVFDDRRSPLEEVGETGRLFDDEDDREYLDDDDYEDEE